MSLHIDKYLSELTKCGPEARFFFEIICRKASDGLGAKVIFRMEELANELHVAKAVARAALGELVESGLLHRVEPPRIGRGRPLVSYKISVQVVANLDCRTGGHSKHLEQLFSAARVPTAMLGMSPRESNDRAREAKSGKPVPPGSNGRLSVCNRLLLAVLLAHSDQFGVTKGLSNLELRRLTGMDGASVKHRIKRLMAVGLIRSYVPGVTSSIFNPKKVCSTYFLNLNHSGFGLDCGIAVVMHGVGSGYARPHAVDIMRGAVLAAKRSSGRYREVPKAVVNLLAGQGRAVFEVLRIRLYQYASELLNRQWSDPEGLKGGAWLCERIEEDLERPNGAGQELDVAINYLYEVVLEIAERYRERFGGNGWIGDGSIQLCIQPSFAEDDQFVTLLCRPRPPKVPAYMLLGQRVDGKDYCEWKAEDEMSLGERIAWGLATAPAKRLLRS